LGFGFQVSGVSAANGDILLKTGISEYFCPNEQIAVGNRSHDLNLRLSENQSPNPEKPEIRNSKIEIRNKSEIPKFKCLKQNYRRDKVGFDSNLCKCLFVSALQRCQRMFCTICARL